MRYVGRHPREPTDAPVPVARFYEAVLCGLDKFLGELPRIEFCSPKILIERLPAELQSLRNKR
jgi:hypothetical protein